MKIVCDACQAKYSISDDKVQGKVFKIRCKKCSNIIVVRGGAGAAEAVAAPAQEKATRVYDYGYEGGDQAPAGDESVWHVVINQDQVGPMTAAEVQQRFSSGEIDAETYAWREGFADWLPLAQVDAFAAFVASGSATAGGGGAGAVAAMFGGQGHGGEEGGTVRSDPGDLFAAASASARHGDDDGGDLFGSKPAAMSAQQQKEAANAKLRGERNENSVLFSLNNLAQLASDKPAPAAASSGATMQGHATGQGGGEGSGLIDIRSMANAYLGGGGGAMKPTTSSAIGSIDDLPVFGGGGFSEPAVIVPTSRSQNNSKLMYILIGSVGLLAVAAVVLVVVMLGKKDSMEPEAEKVASAGSADKVENADKPDTTKPDTTKPDTAGSDTAGSDTAKPDTTKPDTTKPDTTKPDTHKPDTTVKKQPTVGRTNPPAHKDPVTPKEPATKTVVKDPAPSGGCDEVSCVLSNYDGACCAKFKKGGAPKTNPGVQIGEKPKSDVPEALDRSMISAGVAAIKARATACGDRSAKKGIVKVSVKVNPDGSISSVTVKETPDPALGSCVASAMQKARFAKTQNGGSFGFPFPFQ